MVNEMKNLEGMLQHQQYKVMDDISGYKAQFNMKVEEFVSMFSKVQVDNQTTRSLVKKQYDEFAMMYSHIEINKAGVERLERAIEQLPVITALE